MYNKVGLIMLVAFASIILAAQPAAGEVAGFAKTPVVAEARPIPPDGRHLDFDPPTDGWLSYDNGDPKYYWGDATSTHKLAVRFTVASGTIVDQVQAYMYNPGVSTEYFYIEIWNDASGPNSKLWGSTQQAVPPGGVTIKTVSTPGVTVSGNFYVVTRIDAGSSGSLFPMLDGDGRQSPAGTQWGYVYYWFLWQWVQITWTSPADIMARAYTRPPLDVSCTRIMTPVGTIDSTATVVPACSVYNYGNGTATYMLKMRIGTVYEESTQVSSHAYGQRRYVTFPEQTFNWPRGTSWTVSCSTMLTGDANPGNNKATATATMRVNDDVGCTKIVAPVGTIDSAASFTAACSVYSYGLHPRTYQVRMKVGSVYDELATVTNHQPQERRYVTFPSQAFNWPRGVNLAVSCSTCLPGDVTPGNDKAVDTATMRVVDAAVVSIDAPAGPVDSTGFIIPKATVRNKGTVTASFPVKLCIGPTWNDTNTVENVAPGDTKQVSFAPWTVQTGTFMTTCTTKLEGDMAPVNNWQNGFFSVNVHDVGARAIVAPSGRVDPGMVTPKARLRNYGMKREAVDVTFMIGSKPPYSTYTHTVSLGSGLRFADTVISFPSWLATAGVYFARCSTYMASDQVPANDTIMNPFIVAPGGGSGGPWTNYRGMPSLPSGKAVKDGGWITVGPTAYGLRPTAGSPESEAVSCQPSAVSCLYAAKGNKTGDFYSYNPRLDSWLALAPIEAGADGKLPKRGAKGVSDGAGYIYATKGNNTLGFWGYSTAVDSWYPLANVPEGASRKKVKGGTDMVFVPGSDEVRSQKPEIRNQKLSNLQSGICNLQSEGYVYLLKGYKAEFYRYNTVTAAWETRKDAPIGAKPKYDEGSWLAYDGGNTIYAHKAKYHEFYAYDITNDSWTALPAAMPLAGMMGRSKKSKDGGSADYYSGAAYALKGGNTQEFWKYEPASGWTELDTVPQIAFGNTKKKKVKTGAGITNVGEGIFFALKGNKTNELWRYAVAAAGPKPQASSRTGVMAGTFVVHRSPFIVSPNPLRAGFATLRVQGVKGSRGQAAHVRIFDAAGRCVLGQSAVCNLQSAITLDLRALSAGVYLVRLDADGFSATRKLVIQQ